MSALGEWSQYLFNTTVAILALVWLCDGTRRLVAHGVRKAAVIQIASGVAISLVLSGVTYVQYRFSLEVLETIKRPIFSKQVPLADDWGGDCCKNKLESASRQLVQAAYVETGQIHSYFDSSGRRTQFLPTESDIRARDKRVVGDAQLEDASHTLLSSAVHYLIAGLIAVLLGAWLGYEQRKTSANNTAEADARNGGARGSP
jgi:hypothetical protein